jgi:tetratricopeptide (TPR) repeat protein
VPSSWPRPSPPSSIAVPPANPKRRCCGELLLSRYPNLASVDRWRFAAASLAMNEGRYDRAVALFEQVSPDAGTWPDAQLGRAGALRSWAKAEGDPEAARRRWRQLLDTADTVQSAIRSDDAGVLAVYRAEARLALGDPSGALETLEGVGDDCWAAADAARARIEAYTALGRGAEIERELVRLEEAAGARTGEILAAMLGAQPAAPGAPRDEVAVAGALARWLRTTGADVRDRARLELAAADAYRRAERFDEALGLYDGMLSRHPHALEALLGRAECLFALGDAHLGDAMQSYKRIANATAGRHDEHYWQAQLRMLQILSRTGRNTQQIAPYIQRLRRQDPQLGGERFRREFDRLQGRHAS